ncbi:S46 family peptidase [Chitinimonas sp.]|uniref:S46 family peptidase n=1 Tax=Chitinimonas sp. TaxID=1934313 RepID=UPI002F9585AB
MLHRTAIALAICLLLPPALADEGMWTFDNPPLSRLDKTYGFQPSAAWLAHLQQAAVNFGASSSFVSPDGLLLTNHHVALGCIDKLSSPARDLAHNGYVAHQRYEELRCPGSMARVLRSSEDVTQQVVEASKTASGGDAVTAMRKRAIARLEADCKQQTGLACEVVPLYKGSLYHLYRYKEWDDVRLVFAPEYQAAFFGGDADNFVYPRHALDFALLRVYENGQPVRPVHYLKLAKRPVAEGDLVFVAGHPGATDRLLTQAQLATLRDITLPIKLASLKRQQAELHAYSQRSPEAARQALDRLFGTENGLKSGLGQEAALLDPKTTAQKEADEQQFRTAYHQQGLAGDPWAEAEAASKREASRAKELWALGYGYRTLFEYAGQLVEQAYERQLPESERLNAYRSAGLPEIERRLRAKVPFYKDLQVAVQAGYFAEAEQLLGKGHSFVRTVLMDATPQEAAEKAIRNSKLDDVNERIRLLQGGVAAIEASDDPLLQLARKVYPLRRELVRYQETQIETPSKQAAEQLGQARFALYGRELPPDATATLRLSYGKVAGYQAGGISTPWKTTFGGLYARADSFDGKPPFDLAPKVAAARSKVVPSTPLNFVTTADIIGGNSGSPVVNRDGEWVGLIFDSNLESLGNRFAYSDTTARSSAVDARAILHALERIYGAPELARELRGGK